MVATVRVIGRALAGAHMNFVDLAREIESGAAFSGSRSEEVWEPTTWGELARWLREHDHGRLAGHERKFVVEVAGRLVMGGTPSDRQAEWMRRLYAKLGGAHVGR